MMIHLTNSAQRYFQELISVQYKNLPKTINFRLIVLAPGSNKDKIELEYCLAGEEAATDLCLDYVDFKLYIAQDALASLQDAIIDYKYDIDGSTGKLHITAPFLLKTTNIISNTQDNINNSDLFNTIKAFIELHINPILAKHHGGIKLIKLDPIHLNYKFIVEVEFEGGCRGCSMTVVTLKSMVEKTLKSNFPEILEVKDLTDHAVSTNPYYV